MSATTSSTGRATPSPSVTLPVMAASAASSPVESSSAAVSRTVASSTAMSTVSMAPRTDAPIRSSGWSRVIRTARTDRATSAGSPPVTVATTRSSASSSW
jgi:hypothetical protein